MGAGGGGCVPENYLGWQEKDLMGNNHHILRGCKFLICNPEGNKSLERLVGRWENDIKVDVLEIGCVYEGPRNTVYI
jgi:hypothetical protein